MKKMFAPLLALTLLCSICTPAMASYTDEYWEGYDEGFDQGFDAGQAAFEDGKAPAAPTGTREDGYADGYADGYDSGYDNAQWLSEYPAEEQPTAEETLKAAGGVPGKINVKLNDRCIDFGAVWPENRGGRVMAPMRTVLEALGATVEYDNTARTVTASLGQHVLLHEIGTEVVEVYDADDMTAEPRVLVMDCASYMSGGRTMVPVRFFSEGLGFLVEWDSTYQSVVLMDLDVLREKYDSQLSVVNLILSELQLRQEPGKTCREDVKAQLDLTLFDTLNGDKRLRASGKATSLVSEAGSNMTMELDLSNVIESLETMMEADGSGMSLEESEELRELFAPLSLAVLYDEETQLLHIQSPLLLYYILGEGADPDTWIEYPLEELDSTLFNLWGLTEMAGESGLPLTAVDLTLPNIYANWYLDPFGYYEYLKEELDKTVEFVGDANFQKSGSTYTLNAEKLLAEMAGSLYWYLDLPEQGWTVDLDLKVTDQGNGRCTFTGGFQMESAAAAIDLDFASRAAGGEVNLNFHVKNQFRGVITATTTRRITDEAVTVTPPKTEVSMDLDEIYS